MSTVKNTVTIDLDVCTSCELCFKACFIDVIHWDKATAQPVVAHTEDCIGCNACELACPVECIQVLPDFRQLCWPRET